MIKRSMVLTVLLIGLILLFSGCVPNAVTDRKCKVTFISYDGTALKTEYVPKGSAVIPPEPPHRDMMEFTGWSADLDNIINDVIILPLYHNMQQKLYRVEFDAKGGKAVSGRTVQYLEEGDEPDLPVFEKEMCEFIGFSEEIKPVTEDITYHALYKELTITKMTSHDLIDRITFGYNYVGGHEKDNDHGKIFDLLLEAGINTVQLPINWLLYANEDYTVKEDFMNHVKEVVDLVLEKDMFCIICIFDSYTYKWSSLCYNNYHRFLKIMDVMVKDVIESFRDYDERVILSFLGEPRDYRNNGLSGESIHVLNDANEKFVRMVRESGGNNRYRNLIITTGWGQFDGAGVDRYIFPDDEHLIVGVHAYLPSGFVSDKADESDWEKKEEEYKIELLSVMEKIHRNFTEKGIPVMITEFGSVDKGDSLSRRKWLEYYVSCAYNYGIKCFIWDTAKPGNINTFGIIDKETNRWIFPEYTNVLHDMLLNKHYLPFFEETGNRIIPISEGITVPERITSMLDGQTYDVNIEYDRNLFIQKDGKLYMNSKQGIKTIFSFEINGYRYYYRLFFVPDYTLMKTSFTFEVRKEKNIEQCFITTSNFSTYRQHYEWYSTDEEILTVDRFSYLHITKDGTCAVIAIEKGTGKQAVTEVVIKNLQVESFRSITNEKPEI